MILGPRVSQFAFHISEMIPTFRATHRHFTFDIYSWPSEPHRSHFHCVSALRIPHSVHVSPHTGHHISYCGFESRRRFRMPPCRYDPGVTGGVFYTPDTLRGALSFTFHISDMILASGAGIRISDTHVTSLTAHFRSAGASPDPWSPIRIQKNRISGP